MKYLHRHITHRIQLALKSSPIVLINGARQTGKSTLVRNIIKTIGSNKKSATYISFDKPTEMAAAVAAPEAFLTNYGLPLIIDEVQLVPNLFRALKWVVDERRLSNQSPKNGLYLLTGSANILALPKLAEALVGRMSVITLYPLTTAEAINKPAKAIERILTFNFKNIDENNLSLIEAIKRGTYPEITNQKDDVRTLQRDVKQLAELEKIAVLPHLLTVLAVRAGGLLNISDIAREVGLNTVTGKSYQHILKMMFLCFDIKPWYKNIGKRLVKTPKGYLMDTSLVCYLLGYKLEEVAKNNPAVFGHLLENYVATELLKQLNNSASRASLYHFRTSDGKEVDFIIEQTDGSVIAIEVKKAEIVKYEDFKGIETFKSLTGKDFKGGIVLYNGKTIVPFGANLFAVPFSILWG
jgi:uncharacterized protein